MSAKGEFFVIHAKDAAEYLRRVHPSCAMLPEMKDDDFKEFVEDIKAKGFTHRVRIRRSDKMVMGGRHRIKAGKMLSMPIPAEWCDDTDAEAYGKTISDDIERRNLSATEKATLYKKLSAEQQTILDAEAALAEKEADEAKAARGEKVEKKKKAKKAASKKAKAGTGKKAKAEAKKAGVSTATMERVNKVNRKAIPTVRKAMDANVVTAGDAAYIVDFSHDVQQKCLNLVKEGKCKTLKSAKKKLDADIRRAGTSFKDEVGQEVPGKLKALFEDRGKMAILREQLKEFVNQWGKLLKREAGKHIPESTHINLQDALKALDLYQPWAVDSTSEDGWLNRSQWEALGDEDKKKRKEANKTE